MYLLCKRAQNMKETGQSIDFGLWMNLMVFYVMAIVVVCLSIIIQMIVFANFGLLFDYLDTITHTRTTTGKRTCQL